MFIYLCIYVHILIGKVSQNNHNLKKRFVYKINFETAIKSLPCFKAHWTWWLCFLQISNWTGCTSQFQINYVNLVNVFTTRNSFLSLNVQINFKSGSEPILDFKAYDTRYLHFLRIWNWSYCRLVLKQSHE